MSETARFKIPELSATEKVSEGPAKINSALTAIDNINAGESDFLQAGVVESGDWSFTATINSSTGALGSEAATGGRAWLPDPVVSGALMRSVTTAATLSGLAPSTLPATTKFMTIGFELTPTTWGSAATVSLKSGVEKPTEAEAEAASPAVTSGKIRVRDVVVQNAASVYSIVRQIDRRPWATGGTTAESVGEGKIAGEAVTTAKIAGGAVTGAKLGEGTVRQETGTPQSFLSWGVIGEAGAVLAGTGDYTVTTSGTGLYSIVWTKAKSDSPYAFVAVGVGKEVTITASTGVSEVSVLIVANSGRVDSSFSFVAIAFS